MSFNIPLNKLCYLARKCDTRRVNLVTNSVISREWGKDREVLTTSGTYPWSFVTQIFHSGQPSHIYSLYTEITPDFYRGSYYSIFNFMCMFCRSLFVLLYFYFWPLCCLFFFDFRILITPFVSSYKMLPFRGKQYYPVEGRTNI
jgi:hypothetical protein